MTSQELKRKAMDGIINFLLKNEIEIYASEVKDLKAKGPFFRKIVELKRYNTAELSKITADFVILVKREGIPCLILGTVARNLDRMGELKKLLTPISDSGGFSKPVAKGRYGAEMIGADLHIVICFSDIPPTIHSAHEKMLLQSILTYGQGKETIVLEWDDSGGIKQGLHNLDHILLAISAAENRP